MRLVDYFKPRKVHQSYIYRGALAMMRDRVDPAHIVKYLEMNSEAIR